MARIAILAERNLTPTDAKTAMGLLRYRGPEIVAAIDSTRCGRDVDEVLGIGIGRGVPVVRDVPAALAAAPDTLAIGIAPANDLLYPVWREQILIALAAGLDVLNGMHFRMADDAEIAAAARRSGARLHDVRTPPAVRRVARDPSRRAGNRTVLAVGSDGSVGKMTVMLELDRAMRAAGESSTFLATGQTGIMISGSGVPADCVPADFLAGAIQELVVARAEGFDWTFVEGQGALNHPAYSAVTLGIAHGASPDAMILCHAAGATSIQGWPDHPLPSLPRLIAAHEAVVNLPGPPGGAEVVGVALRTWGLTDDEAAAAVARAERETGLPAADVVRFGPEPLIRALRQHRDTTGRAPCHC